MSRVAAFAKRNVLELLRDPLSWAFALGFPLVMLIVMTFIDRSIPPEAGMTVYRVDNLAGGIAIFGQSFIMLFTALTVSGDRSRSLLTRLYAAPMTGADFVLGYVAPMLSIAVLQSVITLFAAFIVSLVVGVEVSVPGLLAAAAAALVPSALMFIGLGLLFGTLFSERAAPGLCSVIISLASFLGGVWFDAERTGGALLTLCRCLPFYYCVKAARAATALNFTLEGFWIPELVAVCCAAAALAGGIIAFGRRMRADLS